MELDERIEQMDRLIEEATARYEQNVQERDRMLDAMGITMEQLDEFEKGLSVDQRQMLEEALQSFGEEVGANHPVETPKTKAPRVRRGMQV